MARPNTMLGALAFVACPAGAIYAADHGASALLTSEFLQGHWCSIWSSAAHSVTWDVHPDGLVNTGGFCPSGAGTPLDEFIAIFDSVEAVEADRFVVRLGEDRIVFQRGVCTDAPPPNPVADSCGDGRYFKR